MLKLLLKDGWIESRQPKGSHQALHKQCRDRKRVTIITLSNKPIPDSTLSQILSESQTGLGKDGLMQLIEKHGLK